jgi:hypothetical protein
LKRKLGSAIPLILKRDILLISREIILCYLSKTAVHSF